MSSWKRQRPSEGTNRCRQKVPKVVTGLNNTEFIEHSPSYQGHTFERLSRVCPILILRDRAIFQQAIISIIVCSPHTADPTTNQNQNNIWKTLKYLEIFNTPGPKEEEVRKLEK